MKYNIQNVHIIFQGGERKSKIDFDRILLRITHLYEEGEDPVLSQPTVINLKVHLICSFFMFLLVEQLHQQLTVNSSMNSLTGSYERHR